MLLKAADGGDLWLAYCMNVHPGGSVASTLDALASTVRPLRARLGVAGPFGVGLRLDAAAVAELRARPALRADLRDRLAGEGFVPFTANGFVVGAFHGRGLKAEVYRPSWRDRARVDYTVGLAEVLADLAAPHAGLGAVSISTSPLAWRRGADLEAEREAGVRHLVEVGTHLRRVAEATGVAVRLGLEPEPGCLLDRTAHVVALFAGGLADRLAAAGASGLVGVCYDVCHQAVMHEDVAAGLAALAAARVPVVKVQASCALEAADPAAPDVQRALRAFDEPVYLHQVGAPDAAGRVHLADDLPDAIADPAFATRRPWRVHFHVPVFRRRAAGPLRTTRPALDAALAAVGRGGVTTHLEIETYTWDVLPEAERAAGSGFDLTDALEREHRDVLAELARAGATELPSMPGEEVP